MPNLTFGPPVLACLRKAVPGAFLDCHVMVTQPLEYVPLLAKAGASGFTFHVEDAGSSPSLQRSYTDSEHSLLTLRARAADPAAVATAARAAGMRVG